MAIEKPIIYHVFYWDEIELIDNEPWAVLKYRSCETEDEIISHFGSLAFYTSAQEFFSKKEADIDAVLVIKGSACIPVSIINYEVEEK